MEWKKNKFWPLKDRPKRSCDGMLPLVSSRACLNTSDHRFALQNLSSWAKRLRKVHAGSYEHPHFPLQRGTWLFPLQRQCLGTNPPWERLPVAVTAGQSQREAKLCYYKTWVTPSTFPMLPQDLENCSIRQSKMVQVGIGPEGYSLQVWSHGPAAAASLKRIYSILQDITLTAHTNPQPTQDPLQEQPHLSSLKRVLSSYRAQSLHF